MEDSGEVMLVRQDRLDFLDGYTGKKRKLEEVSPVVESLKRRLTHPFCVVCLDPDANMSFVHGNTAHLATCEACAKKFKRHNQLGASGAVSRISSPPATSIADRCPVCRQGIECIAKQF